MWRGQERVIKEWIIIERGRLGFKIGLQGIPMRGEGPTFKLYVSEVLSEKHITGKRE
jgi:hypothetical protein